MKLNITLDEWSEYLNRPDIKASNQLNIIEIMYKHNLFLKKERRRARRKMRNLRKLLKRLNKK